MTKKEAIRTYYGRIVGYVETDLITGDQTATDYGGKVLGRYNHKLNITTTYYGLKVAEGNIVQTFIWNDAEKRGELNN